MDDNLPSVTVLIAARPGQAEVRAVAASRGLDYPPDKLEIMVARGRQPSAQRNAGLKAARGDLLYFLDDDSLPLPANLRRAAAHFRRAEVQMVGGPNLCPADAPPLEQVFALVLASWLAFGPSRARYAALGAVRETSEKELILCNLAARRQAMLELGGFNESLYPNEENALMDELQKRGGKLIYDPGFLIERRPRSSLRAFAKMLLTYGRGRAEQFRVNPTPGSALNFVPPLFVVYLVSLAALPWAGKLLLAPLMAYGVAVLAQAAALARTIHAPLISTGLQPGEERREGVGAASTASTGSEKPFKRLSSTLPLSTGLKPGANEKRADKHEISGPGMRTRILRALAAVPLIGLTHVLYGAGFWRGLFTTLKRPEQQTPVEVVLERVPFRARGL